MRREGRILASLVAAGAMFVGFGGTARAAFLFEDGFSIAQPAAELVMPFDVSTDSTASFLLASNPTAFSAPNVPQVTTHWVFWGTNCKELANVSICLTLNDTIVVDPRKVQSVGADNKPVGPVADLSGNKGLVTVVAYFTDEDCSPFNEVPGGSIIRDQALVGTFTIANNISAAGGYSFGNDAMGLFTDGANAVQLPNGSEARRFALEALNPEKVDASLVILAQLEEKEGIVRPLTPPFTQRYFNSFYDTTETEVSLPDVVVGCPAFRTITGGTSPLVPDTVTLKSSGFLSLNPDPNLGDATYLFGLVGEAQGTFGVSSRAKIEFCDGRLGNC